MKENRDLSTPVDELHVSELYSVPVQVSSWEDKRTEVDDEPTWSFYEAALDYRYRRDEGTAIVVAHDSSPVLAMDANGATVRLDDMDAVEAYVEANEEGDEGDITAGSFSEVQLEDLRVAGDVDEYVSGPKMNYWYPVGGIHDDEDAAAAALAIRHLSLCVVEVDGEYGLALTGGGQDMSWDIAEGFVVLGYLPPVHFADLPSRPQALTPRRRYVLKAMLRSLAVASEQMSTRAERLLETFGEFDVEFEVQGKFMHGWEMVTTESTREGAEAQLRTYRENDPAISYRVRKVRAS